MRKFLKQSIPNDRIFLSGRRHCFGVAGIKHIVFQAKPAFWYYESGSISSIWSNLAEVHVFEKD
jgi:hypothetical protein